MKIKIIKLSELENAITPNNIKVGYEKIYEINESEFIKPSIDHRFNIGTFSTSGVKEIIDDNTFKTYNSIYHWEIIN